MYTYHTNMQTHHMFLYTPHTCTHTPLICALTGACTDRELGITARLPTMPWFSGHTQKMGGGMPHHHPKELKNPRWLWKFGLKGCTYLIPLTTGSEKWALGLTHHLKVPKWCHHINPNYFFSHTWTAQSDQVNLLKQHRWPSSTPSRYSVWSRQKTNLWSKM